MASVSPMSESALGLTFGALYFALVFTSILWGVGCFQLYLYYEKYWKHDSLWLKIFIFVAWILDNTHQCLVMDQTYTQFVKAIANPAILKTLSKSTLAIVAVTAFLNGMVHFIFIRRIWYVSSKNWAITGFLSICATALFITTLVDFGLSSHFTEVAQFSSIRNMEIGLNAIWAFTDSLISIVLIWLLWRTRSGIKRTDSIVTRLIIYTISSGLVTAIWAVMGLITAAVAPNTFLYLLADLVIPKLYFNCMLASLNVRSSLRATQATSGMSVHLSTFAAGSGVTSSTSSGYSRKAPNAGALECQIDIEVARSSDGQLPDRKIASSGV